MTVGAFLRARQCTAVAADRPALHRCVAVSLSGGVDSMVIAHILRSTRRYAMLHDKWAYLVCNTASVAFVIIHVFIGPSPLHAIRSSLHVPHFTHERQARFGFRTQCSIRLYTETPIKCGFVTCRLLVRHRAEFSHLEVVGIHIDYANRIGARN